MTETTYRCDKCKRKVLPDNLFVFKVSFDFHDKNNGWYSRDAYCMDETMEICNRCYDEFRHTIYDLIYKKKEEKHTNG